MAANLTTVYDIDIRYGVKGNAKRGVDAIGGAADRADRKARGLRSTLMRVGALIGGGLLFRAGKKHLVDFNSGMEQARIQMAGLMQLNRGGTFNENLREANDLVGKLQLRAKASVGTTKDMVDMASLIVRPVTAAGVGMKGLEDMTVGAVVAARSFGMQAEFAARDIEAALMGNLAKRDRFARALLEPMGFSTDKFNKLSADKRAKVLMKALTSKPIQAMAKAQEQSFAGVTSTLEDNIQMALGKVGLPLMKKLTAEVKRWNDWIDKHPQKIERWAKSFSNALVTGFNAVKGVASWIGGHKDLLMTMAKALLAFKGVKAISGVMGSFGGTAGGPARLLGNVAGVTYVAAKFVAAKFDSDQDKEINKGVNRRSLDRLSTGVLGGGLGAAMTMLSELRNQGLADKNLNKVGSINKFFPDARSHLGQKVHNEHSLFAGAKAFVAANLALQARNDNRGILEMEKLSLKWYQKLAPLGGNWAQAMGMATLQQVMGPFGPRSEESDRHIAKPPDLKATIHIEIASNDPDRFAHDFTEAMERLHRSPSQAASALRGGF
jgi:hypothetical protein